MQSADPDRAETQGRCSIGDPVSALASALELWHTIQSRGDRAVAELSQQIAWLCFTLSDIETGLAHALSSRRFFADAGLQESEIISAALYAWLLLESGLGAEASDEAARAVCDAQQCGSALAMSWALNVQAVVFWYRKQLDRAEPLIIRAVALARELDNPQLLGWWIINLAGIRSEWAAAAKDQEGLQSLLAEALDINREAIALAELVGDVWALQLALCNAAEYQIAIGDYLAAERSLARWMEVAPPTGPRSLTFYATTKTQLLNRQGRWTEALVLCDDALAQAQRQSNTESEAQALRLMSDIHEGLGRFDLALDFFKRFHSVHSRLAAEGIQRRARLADIHYETERLKSVADQATSRADALARISLIDPLTGVGNRRLLEGSFGRLEETREDFSIAVVDLDHFKQINDRFSHAVGDEVLRRVAAALQSSIAERDSVARIGGEEFVLVLGGKTARAVSVCEDVLAKLATLTWSDIDVTLSVTCSIGIASYGEALGPVDVMAVADERLYRAKASGRNRIVARSAEANEQSGLQSAEDSPSKSAGSYVRSPAMASDLPLVE